MMNKKGVLVDFGLAFLGIIVIFVIGILMIFIMNANANAKINDFKEGVVIRDGSYSTRVILQMELEPNYKVYNFIIDAVKDDDYERIKNKMPEIIEAFTDSDNRGSWAYVVNRRIGSYNTGYVPIDAMILIDKVTIPNPYGEDIEVMIKRITPEDEVLENKRVKDISYEYEMGKSSNP